ncbi:hypothetical protein ABFV05_009068 [Capra hircus]
MTPLAHQSISDPRPTTQPSPAHTLLLFSSRLCHHTVPSAIPTLFTNPNAISTPGPFTRKSRLQAFSNQHPLDSHPSLTSTRASMQLSSSRNKTITAHKPKFSIRNDPNMITGPKTPSRSFGEASSFTVQMRSFQGHVCTGPAGVRVRECVRVRVSVCRRVGAAAGGDPGRPRPQRPGPLPRGSHPPAFSGPRGPGPGSSPAPAPPPHCGAATATATATAAAAPAPTARGGGREEPGTTSAPPPPPRRPARAPLDSPRRGVPPNWHSPHPRRPSQIRWHPAPPATGGRRKIAAQRSPARPPDHPSARPPGASRVPPPRRAEEGREPGGRGGGPGRARLPFSAAAAEPARGPAPAPLPRSLRAAAGADYSGSGSAPSSAPAAGPRLGPGAGAGTARKAGAARPGPLRQRLAGHRG